MRKFIAVLAVLLCIAPPCAATQYYHLRDYVTTKSGYVVSGASVYIYAPNSITSEATAYSDLAGSSAVSFPLTTDANGMFECYLESGNYDVVITHSGWSISTTWDNYMVAAAADTVAAGEFTIVETDTMHPNTGVTLYVRAADGQNDATLDVFKADVDSLTFAILSATYVGNLPTASGHTSQFWFNTALDSCWVSTGAAWIQVSP